MIDLFLKNYDGIVKAFLGNKLYDGNFYGYSFVISNATRYSIIFT